LQFHSFWPIYLASHGHPATRAAHYLATISGLSGGPLALSPLAPWWALPVGIAIGYLLAFGSHLVIERNRPTVIQSPKLMLLTTAADFYMCALALQGRIDAELRRHGLDAATARAETATKRSRRPDRDRTLRIA